MSTVDTRIVEWLGDEVDAKVRTCTRRAMDRIMADCVESAKELVPKKTTALQRSIQMRPTKEEGRALIGYWGSFGINYAIYQELGTGLYAEGGSRGMYEIRPRRRKALWWPGLDHPLRVVHHPGVHPRPYLRPSADAIYPALPTYIREEFAA